MYCSIPVSHVVIYSKLSDRTQILFGKNASPLFFSVVVEVQRLGLKSERELLQLDVGDNKCY